MPEFISAIIYYTIQIDFRQNKKNQLRHLSNLIGILGNNNNHPVILITAIMMWEGD